MLNDIRFAARLLLKNKTFALGVIATLALGIGANSAIFTIVHGVLIQPLHFRAPERLVWATSRFPDADDQPFSVPEFMDYRAGTKSLDELAALASSSMTLVGEGDAERLQALSVSAHLFSMLGVSAAIGRTLTSDDDLPGSNPVVVLANGVWKRRFGADPSVLGRAITLNGRAFTVVGVLPSTFALPFRDTDIIVPLSPDTHPWRNARGSVNFLRLVGRLKPGVTLEQAEAELTGITGQLKERFPGVYSRRRGVKLAALRDRYVKDSRGNLLMLFGAVTAVLLIACTNLASLFLARASSRYREFAIRTSLGATRSRVVRQLFAEVAVITAVSGLIGIGVAVIGVRAFVALGPTFVPRLSEVHTDYRIVGFTAIATVIAALVFGLVPALQPASVNLTESLRDGTRSTGGRGRTRIRSVLVVAEMTLAVALLSCAGLLLQSLRKIQNVEPGFDASGVLSARLALPPAAYPNRDRTNAFYERLSTQLRAVPGVVSVGATSILPMSGPLATIDFTIDGIPSPRDAETPVAMYRMVSPDYFSTVRVPLLRGRQFDGTDRGDGHAVAIINRRLAERFFGTADPLGKMIRVDDNATSPRPLEIVGVVGDVKHDGLDAKATFDVYVPMLQVNSDAITWLRNNQFWVVRTHGDPMALADAFRRELRGIDITVAANKVMPFEDYLSTSLAQRRFNLRLLSVFALAALALVGSGLYALISYMVNERRQELAIRLALGAEQGRILRGVVGRGLVLAGMGLIAGLVMSSVVTRMVQAQLFGVQRGDPTTLIEVTVTLLAIAGLASLVPGLRATRVNPADAMRM